MTTSKMEEILSLRASGLVKRWHTAPTLHQQTVSEHSGQAVSLLLLLHPDPSVNLIKGMLWHDSSERHVGDVPSPVRRAEPDFARMYEQIEVAFMEEIHSTAFNAIVRLTPLEMTWLKAIDVLELFLYCHDEVALGNTHFVAIEKRARGYLLSSEAPSEIIDFINRHQHRSFA